MDLSYWKKQSADSPLFPDIEWSKPEQRIHAGRLGIIGGNALGFAGVAEAYSVALQSGVGEARSVLPDALRKTIPKHITETAFAPSTPAGSLGKDAEADLMALAAWASGILMIGDAGRNSETAILYERFLQSYKGPVTITRDAIDLIKHNPQGLVERPDTTIVAAFAQLQKLFQGVYYPKVLTFSMQLLQMVDALHKFTLTYPVTIVTLHKDTLIIADGGQVITTPWENPMAIWRGSVAARIACYTLWNPTKKAEAIATAVMSS